MWNLPQHSYEEIREVVIDVLLRRENTAFAPEQWGNLTTGVAEVFARRSIPSGQTFDRHERPRVDPRDAELIRDVFWDLFRQGFITLGLNDSNPNWPFFRLSHFGERTLQAQNPYRFHDTSSFLALVKSEVPDISDAAIAYLDESVSAFYAGCLLASCVMLGVAAEAEAEFLRLVDVAAASGQHGSSFSSVPKQTFIRQKIAKFQGALRPLLPSLPRDAAEDLDANFTAIQSILRTARNDAGHPTAKVPPREQVYVFLQLFIPFARQLLRLRKALS
jgi:hypothetical protein